MLPDGVSPYPGQMCLYVYRDGAGEAVFSRHAGGVTLLGHASPAGGRGLARSTLQGLARLYGPIEVFDPAGYDAPDVQAFWQAALQDRLVTALQDEAGHDLPPTLVRLDEAA